MNSKRPTLNLIIGTVLMILIIFVSHTKALENGKIVFESNNGIWTMNPNGSGRTQIAANGNYPKYSPDGAKIAFYRGDEVWLINADGSNERFVSVAGQLTFFRRYALSWSPDSTKIVLAARWAFAGLTRTATTGLRSVTIRGTASRIGRPTAQKSFFPDDLFLPAITSACRIFG
ncbi:hypothetical protein BH10ACI1_BH10ACI1_10660 [soil metagenome]